MNQMKRIRFCDQCSDRHEVDVLEREATYSFREDGPFTITERYAKCTVCGYDVTDEELDSETLRKLGRLYEDKHAINADWSYIIISCFSIGKNLFLGRTT